MNLPTRALIRGAVVTALGIAAGCFAFHSDAASVASTSLGSASIGTTPPGSRPLAFVNGKLTHPTRIEEGVGAPVLLPRDTNGAFMSVSLEMDAEVLLKAGPQYEVQVSTERNLQKYIQAERVGPSLLISTSGSYATHHPVKVVITVPALQELDLTGNGKAELAGNFGKALAVSAEGGWTLSGSGAVDSLTLTLSDSSAAALKGFKSHDLMLHGSTTGAMTVYCSSALDGELAGPSSLVIYGHPAHHALKLGHGSPRFAS